jgi:putative transposase
VSIFIDEPRDRFGVEPICRVWGLSGSAITGARAPNGAASRGGPRTVNPIAQRRPDLVQRDFTADEPNRLRVGDLSYLRCWEGAVYFAFVIDAFQPPDPRLAARRSHAHRPGPRRAADGARDTGRSGHRAPGAEVRLGAHADRGSQYTSAAYPQVLDDHRVPASVGSVRDAYDNPMDESLVDSVKTDLIADRVWRTRVQLELAIVG